MIRSGVFSKIALALFGIAALCLNACDSPVPSRAAVKPAPAAPRFIKQAAGVDLLELNLRQVPGMTLTTVREVQLPGVLETNGQVTFDDRNVSSIVSRVQGRIEATRISLWDDVRKGQLILALYSPDFMTAEAELLQARTTQDLSGAPGLPNEPNLGATLVAAAKRKLQLLGLSDADIAAVKQPDPVVWMRAPISGTVLEKKAIQGAQVNPGDVLLSLGTLDPIWITADIYEADLARVHEGQILDAIVTAFPGTIFKGVVKRVSPNINPDTHTMEVRCSVPNPGHRLKPQMLARVSIITQPGRALVVSQAALIFDTNNYYAFVEVLPDMFERRPVKIASWNEHGYARVTSGLKAGDRVVGGESIQVNALWHEARGETS